MANPPFNVDRIDKAKLEDDPRFPDLPKADNGNYIWIQLLRPRSMSGGARVS
jgi:type I restriction enzyme M protein